MIVNSTTPFIKTYAHEGVRYLIPLAWRNPPAKLLRGLQNWPKRPALKIAQAQQAEEPEKVE